MGRVDPQDGDLLGVQPGQSCFRARAEGLDDVERDHDAYTAPGQARQQSRMHEAAEGGDGAVQLRCGLPSCQKHVFTTPNADSNI
ncbi:hypothetical protein SSPO_001300 [Streptomyces antimycoticus]|uniref:Uncharacterized protein n=1 Tax=Streptomyces antimycoticus TaxID=68175 RepID=A0A499UBL5_9ACTN|nr:hypothetical protein SSPO_001300 [Streptomyces antimycoticus]